MASDPGSQRLKKELGLGGVFAVSVGAMLSSGFFLLPGLAAAKSGPSVVLAYAIAALLTLPALFSKAELSTAMPRAGGTYFFLDRSLGPMVGTVGGIGTWVALSLKSAFALIGMGAYLGLVVGLPIKPVAVGFVLVIVILNIVGVEETTGFQKVLVFSILALLAVFIVSGLGDVFSRGAGDVISEKFQPFAPFGAEGVLSTVGLVFVSFAGLTKVASIPEEIRDPERNVPLGMLLSVAVAAVIYVLGIGIMVAVLEPDVLRGSLTPVAAAGERVLDWIPGGAGGTVVVIAAIAAFSAMANAGLLAASRYPLAMARDRIVSPALSELTRFRTPGRAVVLTGGIMIACIVLLDVEGVAKLASSLKLLIFSFVNLAVIVMRESQIQAYDPGFRSPLYPWMQIVGFLVPLWLIAEIGVFPLLFTLGVVLAGTGWYRIYVRERVDRAGAMHHVFERLGRKRSGELEGELRQILKEKGVREEDFFERVIDDAEVFDAGPGESYREAVARAVDRMESRLPEEADALLDSLIEGARTGQTPVSHGVALPHARIFGIDRPYLALIRSREGVALDGGEGGDGGIHAIFLLVSPERDASRHLRLLAEIAARVEEDEFLGRWLDAAGPDDLRRTLLGERGAGA